MQTVNSMFDSTPLDFDMQPSLPIISPTTMPPASTMPPVSTIPPASVMNLSSQQPLSKPPVANIVKPVPKNSILPNKNSGFSNLPDLPSVPTDAPARDNQEKRDDYEETDFDELLNRFEDLKNNKK